MYVFLFLLVFSLRVCCLAESGDVLVVEIHTCVCQGVVTGLELRRPSSGNMYVFVVAVVFVVVVCFLHFIFV